MENEKVFNGFDDDMDFIDLDDFDESEEKEEESTEEETETDGKEEESTEEEKTESQEDNTEEDSEENAKTEEELEAERKAEELHKRNEEQKAKRLKREAEEKERLKREAKLEGKLEVLKTNPYTREEIKDEEDLKVYEIQKQLDDEGLDPIEDLPKRLAEINRKTKKEELERAKTEEENANKMQQDLQDFMSKNPNVDMNALRDDDDFWDFAHDFLGNTSLDSIYRAYQKTQKKISAKEKEAMIDKKAKDISKKITKTPSASGSNNKANKGFLEMTDEEYIQLQKEESGDFF